MGALAIALPAWRLAFALAPRTHGVEEAIADPDAALIQRVGQGQRGAFDELYRRYADVVYRRLSRLIGPDPEVEDLMQQIFIDVFRSLPGFRGEAPFSSWLHRIIVRVACEQLTRRRRRRLATPVPPEALEYLISENATPEEAALEREEVERLFECLSRLKPKKRIAFVLRVIEGLSLEQIGQLVGARPPAVGQRVQFATRELNSMLERAERQDTERRR
jgi:RNA polymerase sigma-70 factor (ECF subfamily)